MLESIDRSQIRGFVKVADVGHRTPVPVRVVHMIE